MSYAGPALVVAESILALTPIAIKKTPLDPLSAVWSRVLTSAGLGYLLSTDRGLSPSEYGGAGALGLANLLHVATSYESFRHLQAGHAMALLYTYPLWNLVLNAWFNQEPITGRDYGLISLAALGSIVLNLDPGHVAPTPLGRRADTGWGILMGILMAITESIMNVILRRFKWQDAAKSVFVVNGSAGLWLAAALVAQSLFDHERPFQIGLQSGTWTDAFWLTVFHAFTMFSGYWLRFYAVPRLSVVTYALLSYAGLFASYLFGLFFLGEKPGWMSILGALIILASGIMLQMAPKT